MPTPEEVLSKDPILANIMAHTPLFKKGFDSGGDVYLALQESIVSQQISVKAADAIFARFVALFPDNYPAPALLLAKSTEELRTAGLSFQKINYLRNVAEFTTQNDVSKTYFDTLSDEEIIEYLTPIKGIGRWTVEMILMFCLDRPDVFPIDDLVVRQKMITAYTVQEAGKAQRQRLTEIAEHWRPYRSLACRYLWRWQVEK